MKFLRGLYMVIAWIVTFPLTVLVSLIWLILLTAMCAYIGEINKAIPAWLGYMKRGIEMNIDFVENGF